MPDSEQMSGKTGSCSDSVSRIGWFVSYVDQAHLKMVLVILMRGDTKAVRGPMAAGIAGRIYHQLNEEEYSTKQDTEAAVSTVAAKTNQ